MKNALATLVLLCCGAPLFAELPQGYALKWSDEFDGAELDKTKWVHWLPGKRRHAMNVPDAVTLRDGFLTIATYTEAGKHFTGMISTRDKYEVQYGYYEARIEWADAPGQ